MYRSLLVFVIVLADLVVCNLLPRRTYIPIEPEYCPTEVTNCHPKCTSKEQCNEEEFCCSNICGSKTCVRADFSNPGVYKDIPNGIRCGRGKCRMHDMCIYNHFLGDICKKPKKSKI